jgi:hypothetical protein
VGTADGLACRRRQRRTKGTVLAFSDELDAWTKSQFKNGHQSELELLRSEVAELRRENKRLCAQLEAAEGAAMVIQANGSAHAEWLSDELLWKRCYLAIEKSIHTRLCSAEVIEMSRNLQLLRDLSVKKTGQLMSIN